MNELKYALRRALARPGLSIVMIAMLALGLGATTAIFSVFNELLVRPLPVHAPHELVNLAAPGIRSAGARSCSDAGTCDEIFSYPMYHDLAAAETGFAGIAAHRDFYATVTGDGAARSANGILVSGSYFGVLGLTPAAGRLIDARDEPRVDEGNVVVLTYDYWQSAFGGNPAAIGRVLTVNGQPLTVIGVAPRGFTGTIVGLRPQVFVPLTMRWRMEPTRGRDEDNRRSYWVYLFARLEPGVTLAAASASLNVLYRGILETVEVPLNSALPADLLEQFRNGRIDVTPGAAGQSSIPDDAARPLVLLLGITALVLLIVCVNVANLLLARGVARAGELALRVSIGASRARLVGGALLDAALPALAGGLLSLPVAMGTLQLIAIFVPMEVAAGMSLAVDATALAFAAGAATATVLLFGPAPALQALRTNPVLAMKGQSSQSVGGHGMARVRSILVTTQIAFSMLLLVLAGLFAKSLANVAGVDLGMSSGSVVTFAVSPRMSGQSREDTMRTFDRIEERLAAEPGVTSVGSARIAVLTGRGFTTAPEFPGFAGLSGADNRAMTNQVSPGFFGALATPVLAGRDFSDADTLGAPVVAVVNQTFVRQFKLGEDAIGRHFRLSGRWPDVAIVGVVGDTKYRDVKLEVPPQLYLSRRQDDNLDGLTYYVRGGVSVDALLERIPRVIAEAAPGVAVRSLTSLDAQIDDNVYLDRLTALLAAGFAGLATLLAALGLYGVLAYGVAQRTRELGLRLALGATPGGLQRLIARHVARIALIGGGAGLLAGLGLGRFAEALLFGLSGRDPAVLAAAAAVLAAVIAAATYLPARRAAGVAPMEALRHE
ncbi:MAG TPA: ADOP family duplicated permease [Gammaproteobacteria bacterium]|nr:ADOP family duplicated permease [Gammaproteobacteria bacterium]